MWYRNAIDTSKAPFEIEEPKTQMHPLLANLHQRIESGEINEVEFFPTLVAMARDNPNRRKNFRARHNCDNPGSKTKARYWSCRQWSNSKSDI